MGKLHLLSVYESAPQRKMQDFETKCMSINLHQSIHLFISVPPVYWTCYTSRIRQRLIRAIFNFFRTSFAVNSIQIRTHRSEANCDGCSKKSQYKHLWSIHLRRRFHKPMWQTWAWHGLCLSSTRREGASCQVTCMYDWAVVLLQSDWGSGSCLFVRWCDRSSAAASTYLGGQL